MTAEAWDLLVRRLEAKAKSEPRSYRLRVALLAALGYAVIAGALVVAVAGLALSLLLTAREPAAFKLVFLFGPLAWVIVRALPVKLPPPEGLELARRDAPELFALVDELRKQLSAPRIHHLLVDDELNASVAQIPRLGAFGPSRNYLVVGLPLLDALSPDEFRAVLAHELEHVSARHGRFSAWVYRLRQTWARIQASLNAQQHWGAGVFRRFFRWYSPYFGAFSFVLAREHEYEADRAAAEAAGPQAAATALSRLEIASHFLGERYWPGVYAGTKESAHPTANPFAELPAELRSPQNGLAAREVAASALARRTGTGDTHPSLSDRLAGLGVEPHAAVQEAASPISESAAERFLGGLRHDVAQQFDAEWHANVAEWWADGHREWEVAEARLAELDQRAAQDGLPRDLMLEHARLVERFRGEDAALPHYRGVLERNEGSAEANFTVGRILLARGDETGLRHLERAMDEDAEATFAACELAHSFLERRGQHAEADRYRARAHARGDLLDEAYEERQTIGSREELREANLPAEVVDDLCAQLAGHREVERAYLARRVHSHLDEEFPSYVVGVRLKFWRLKEPSAMVQLLAQELRVPGDFFVVDLGQSRGLSRRMRKLEGALIYRR